MTQQEGAFEAAESVESEPWANTEESTPGLDFGLGEVEAGGGQRAEDDYTKKLEKSLEDLKRTLGRQSGELGELRKLAQASMAEEPESEVDYTDMLSDPAAFARRLKEDLRRELRAENEKQMEPVNRIQAVQRLSKVSPLAGQLLSNQRVIERLRELGEDDTMMATFQDPLIGQLSSALITIAGEMWREQQSARAKVTAPKRAENAGMASPPAAGGGPAPKTSSPTKPKNLMDAIRLFEEGVHGGR